MAFPWQRFVHVSLRKWTFDVNIFIKCLALFDHFSKKCLKGKKLMVNVVRVRFTPTMICFQQPGDHY